MRMVSGSREIFLIAQDDQLTWNITRILVAHDYRITTCRTITEALGKVYETPPLLIIIHEPLVSGKGLKQLKSFKKDNLFFHIPVVLLVSPAWEKQNIDWDEYPVEEYLTTAFRSDELVNRISLCVTRFFRALDPNPLTRLPGNTSILRQIQHCLDLGKNVAIAYLDIDNFKAFNDRYGFSRGDEALRMAARILSNIIKDYRSEDSFVGHVGGDDFVFIVPTTAIDEVCNRVIANFDAIIPSLYDEEDRRRGCIVAKDRSGKKQTFPLMSVSIAVVSNEGRRLSHYGEVSAIASQVKKHVKKLSGSNYLVDRRKAAPQTQQ
ncbi:MAG: diguanylate cyclase [Desulfobacterota bacterium]|nr:diguanylate cyclase [Thermodesulfobacteriota bacterium]